MLTAIAGSPGVVSVVTPGMVPRMVGRSAPWKLVSRSSRPTAVLLAMAAPVVVAVTVMVSRVRVPSVAGTGAGSVVDASCARACVAAQAATRARVMQAVARGAGMGGVFLIQPAGPPRTRGRRSAV